MYRSLSLALVALALLAGGPGRSVAEEKAAPKKIEGLGTNKWSPEEVTVKEGDVVEWWVKKGTHGVIFKDWDKAKQVLEVLEGSLEIKKQTGFDLPAQGTKGVE